MENDQNHSGDAPVISIILPFFNAEKTIKRALESISHQSYGNFECIVINNNSSDGGIKIVSEYCKKDRRFLLLHENVQGVSFAFNRGLKEAKGRFNEISKLLCLDTDKQIKTSYRNLMLSK